ncbi:hypothetical protein OSTOST_08832 [Ostertagia ostertagi]
MRSFRLKRRRNVSWVPSASTVSARRIPFRLLFGTVKRRITALSQNRVTSCEMRIKNRLIHPWKTRNDWQLRRNSPSHRSQIGSRTNDNVNEPLARWKKTQQNRKATTRQADVIRNQI